MNGWDILLLALIALALAFALRKTLKNRGSCSCGGNCSGCGGNCSKCGCSCDKKKGPGSGPKP